MHVLGQFNAFSSLQIKISHAAAVFCIVFIQAHYTHLLSLLSGTVLPVLPVNAHTIEFIYRMPPAGVEIGNELGMSDEIGHFSEPTLQSTCGQHGDWKPNAGGIGGPLPPPPQTSKSLKLPSSNSSKRLPWSQKSQHTKFSAKQFVISQCNTLHSRNYFQLMSCAILL